MFVSTWYTEHPQNKLYDIKKAEFQGQVLTTKVNEQVKKINCEGQLGRITDLNALILT